MAYIFGSGWDQLAGQRNYKDAQAIALAEADRAARQRAIDQEQENYKFQQQMAAREDEQAARLQQQAYATQLGLDQNRHQELREDYRFRVGRDDQAASLLEDKRRFSIGETFKKDELQLKRDAITGEIKRNDYAEAVNAIDTGVIKAEQDIDRVYPGLTPIQRTRASLYLKHGVDAQNEDYGGLVAAARAATAIVRPVTPEAMKAFDKKEGGMWVTGWGAKTVPGTAADLPKLTEDTAFGKLTGNKSLQKFLPVLQWDEEAQRFMPLMKQPSSYQFNSTTGKPATAPALSPAVTNLAMNVPPMVAPTAGTPPYSFSQTNTVGARPVANSQTNEPYRFTTGSEEMIQSPTGSGLHPRSLVTSPEGGAIIPAEIKQLFDEANAAIAKGKDREAVRQLLGQRLAKYGWQTR